MDATSPSPIFQRSSFSEFKKNKEEDLLSDAETPSNFSVIPCQKFIVSAFSLGSTNFSGSNLQQNSYVLILI